MADSQRRSDGLSWLGVLLIVGAVGLSTAFNVHTPVGGTDSITGQLWLPEFSVHVGLGLVVIGAIVFHRRQ